MHDDRRPQWLDRVSSDLAGAYSGVRAVVTGGAGFIGGHLCEALLALGASLCIVDDLSAGDPDIPASLLDAHPDRVRFVHASVLDPRSLDDAFERARLVFHLAAMSSSPQSVEEPERCLAVNVNGTVEVCQAARIAGARRVVLASTCAVYGEAASLPIREDAPPRPSTPYAASKLAAEFVVAAWARCFGLPGVSLRLFNVYGPGQRAGAGSEGAVVATFAARLAEKEPPVILGDGRQTRDFIHVADAVHALLLAGVRPEKAQGDPINIGSGQATSIESLARLLAHAAGRPDAPIARAPARQADIAQSQADIDRARSLLGFSPSIPLSDGLEGLIAPDDHPRAISWMARAK